MKEKDYSNMTNEELHNEEKKIKPNFIVMLVVILLMVLLAIFNTIKIGIGIYTFLPLIFAPIFLNHLKKYRILKGEINSRNKK
jgi:uncharacterized protein (DUF983 family)